MIPGRLREVDTSAVSDALDAKGLHNQVALGLHALFHSRRIAGPVVPIKLVGAQEVVPQRHLGTAAIDVLQAGDVIVVDNSGRLDVAGWGGNLALAAMLKGAEGVVIDGMTRDLDEIHELKLPMYGRGATPRTARGRVVEQSFNEPISIAGVRVEPGDFVVADMSGVVFVPRRLAEDIVAGAETIMRRDNGLAERIRAGAPASQVMGATYERLAGDDPARG